MSDSSFCKTCSKYMSFPEHHKCPPTFEVFIADYHDDDDGMTVNAYDAEEAAEKAVEEYDSDGDYSCINGEEVTVRVQDSNGLVKRFVVTAEARPVYYASEVL